MTLIEEIAGYLSCKTDTVVTILVTISIFIAGLLTNAIISRIKKSGDRKSYRRYFYSLIDNIRDYSQIYAPILKDSIDSLRMENQPLFILKRRTENSFQTFDKIQFEKTYEAFFSGIICKKKLRRKSFNFILNTTSLIKYYYDTFPNDVEKLHATFQRFENEWNTNIDNIRNVYEVLRQQYFANELNPNYVEFFKEFDSIIKIWFSQEDRTNRRILKAYIIDQLNQQFFIRHKELDITPRLDILSADAHLAFTNMTLTLENYKRHFNNYYIQIKQYDRKMAAAQNILIKTNLNG